MHEMISNSSNSIAVSGDAIAVESRKNRARIIPQQLQQAALVCLQLAGLSLLNFAGVWTVQKTALPVPGNLVAPRGPRKSNRQIAETTGCTNPPPVRGYSH